MCIRDRWYSSGKKRSEQKYILGLSSGIRKWTYHDNGKIKSEENYLNRKDTDVEFEIRLIASPIKFDTDKISIFLAFFILL